MSHSPDIVVGTVTLARSAEQERSLQSALTVLASRGLPIAVADGGSSPGFVETLRRLPRLEVVSMSKGAGLVAQVRRVLRLAQSWNSRRILYTEPDKREFFANHLEKFLSSSKQHANAGIVMAARSRESFATFPASQQYAEAVVNKLCADATGTVTDYCYGPFLLDPALVTELDGVPASIGWGWRPFVFAKSAAAGKGLASIVGPFACPGAQRQDNSREWLHRLRQLSENLAGLTLACEMDRAAVSSK